MNSYSLRDDNYWVYDKCSYCGSKNIRVVYSDDAESIIYYQCQTCKLVQQSNETFDPYEKTTVITETDRRNHVLRYAEYIKNFCYEHLVDMPNIKLLEIGADEHYGNLLRNYFIAYDPRKFSLDSKSLTLPNYYPAISDNRADDNMIYFDFNRPVEIKEKFDFIIMRYVLEHLTDLNTVFFNLRTLLSDKGIIYIEVPDLYLSENRIDNVFLKGHKYLFTMATLEKIVDRYGFRILKKQRDYHYANIKLVIAKKYLLELSNLSDNWVKNKLILYHLFVYPIINFWRKLCTSTLFLK